MSRKRLYNHNRFDGGMTNNLRDTSNLTKLALISHLDIYQAKNEMRVMPGFEQDSAFGGSPTGARVFDVRAFAEISGALFALGTRADGTGSKILEYDFAGSTWRVPAGGFAQWAGEGTLNLINYPFFWFNNQVDFHYPVVSASTTRVAMHGANAAGFYNGTWQPWLSTVTVGRTDAVQGFTGDMYITKGGQSPSVSLITPTAVTPNFKTTAANISAIATGNYQIGLAGTLSRPLRAQTILWDSASLLADQNLQTGIGFPIAIGCPSGVWAVVNQSSNNHLIANGRDEMTVRVVSGENVETLYKVNTVNAITTNVGLYSLNGRYQDSMLWYGRLEVRTGVFIQGIWALGKGDIDGQFGVSLLLDTTSLGVVENANVFGLSMYFAHNNNGSISRLGNFRTGAYNVPATIETLIYGAETPYLKGLDGVSIVTENLPAGGSIECSYRTDENDTWTLMGTSSTVGRQKHSFTKANGTPIGRFQEIQFRFVITGRVTVKNIMIQIEESNDLPF